MKITGNGVIVSFIRTEDEPSDVVTPLKKWYLEIIFREA